MTTETDKPIELKPAYTRPCPPPGVYRGKSDAEYHSWRALNASLLKSGDTPREWKHAMDNPQMPTAAMRVGTLLHLAVLQPDVYDGLDLVEVEKWKSPETNRCRTLSLTSSGEYLSEADQVCGGIAVHPEWSELVDKMRTIVYLNDRALDLMKMVPDENRELSIVWDHPKTGVRCKARIDALGVGENPEDGKQSWFLIDLKTTRALGSPFASQASKLGYHISMAHYCNAVHYAMGVPRDRIVPVFIGLLKEPVIDCQVLWLADEFLDVGRVQLSTLILRYALALADNNWTGYYDSDLKEQICYPPYSLMSKFHGGEI